MMSIVKEILKEFYSLPKRGAMTVAKPQTGSKRQVLLYPGEDGYLVAEVPSLPGCISQGKTREEALRNIEEAIELYIEVLSDRGEPIPDDKVEIVLI
jgi:predicted RNase H-like HicB family nuclease